MSKRRKKSKNFKKNFFKKIKLFFRSIKKLIWSPLNLSHLWNFVALSAFIKNFFPPFVLSRGSLFVAWSKLRLINFYSTMKNFFLSYIIPLITPIIIFLRNIFIAAYSWLNQHLEIWDAWERKLIKLLYVKVLIIFFSPCIPSRFKKFIERLNDRLDKWDKYWNNTIVPSLRSFRMTFRLSYTDQEIRRGISPLDHLFFLIRIFTVYVLVPLWFVFYITFSVFFVWPFCLLYFFLQLIGYGFIFGDRHFKKREIKIKIVKPKWNHKLHPDDIKDPALFIKAQLRKKYLFTSFRMEKKFNFSFDYFLALTEWFHSYILNILLPDFRGFYIKFLNRINPAYIFFSDLFSKFANLLTMIFNLFLSNFKTREDLRNFYCFHFIYVQWLVTIPIEIYYGEDDYKDSHTYRFVKWLFLLVSKPLCRLLSLLFQFILAAFSLFFLHLKLSYRNTWDFRLVVWYWFVGSNYPYRTHLMKQNSVSQRIFSGSKRSEHFNGMILRKYSDYIGYDWQKLDQLSFEKQKENYRRWFRNYPKTRRFFLKYVIRWELRNLFHFPAFVLSIFLKTDTFLNWIVPRIYYHVFVSSNFYKTKIHSFHKQQKFIDFYNIVIKPSSTFIYKIFYYPISIIIIIIGIPILLLLFTWSVIVTLWCYPFYYFFKAKDAITSYFSSVNNKNNDENEDDNNDDEDDNDDNNSGDLTLNKNAIPSSIDFKKDLQNNVQQKKKSFLKSLWDKINFNNPLIKLFFSFINLILLSPVFFFSFKVIIITIKLLNPFLWIRLIRDFILFLKETIIFFYHLTLQFIAFCHWLYDEYYPWFCEELNVAKQYCKSIIFITTFSFKSYYISTKNSTVALFNFVKYFFYSLTFYDIKQFFSSYEFIRDKYYFFTIKLWNYYKSWYYCTLDVLGANLENRRYNFYPRFRRGRKPLLRLRIFREVEPLAIEFRMMGIPETVKWRVDYRGYNISWKNIKKNFWYAWINYPKIISQNWDIVVTFMVFFPLIVYLSFWQLWILKFIWSIIDNIFTLIYEAYIFPLAVKFLIIPIIRCVKFLLRVKILLITLFWLWIITKPIYLFVLPLIVKLPYIITFYLNMHYFELWYWCQKGWHIAVKSYGWYPLVQKKYFIYKIFKIPFKIVAKKKAWFKIAFYYYKFYFSLNFFLWWTVDSSGFLLLTIGELFTLTFF